MSKELLDLLKKKIKEIEASPEYKELVKIDYEHNMRVLYSHSPPTVEGCLQEITNSPLNLPENQPEGDKAWVKNNNKRKNR